MTKTDPKPKRPPASNGEGREAASAAAEPRPSRRAGAAPNGGRRSVDASLIEFSANGYAAARLDDIAARAGVAKGTIYLYFADKEALFQELIRTIDRSDRRPLGPPPAPGTSAREMFERFIQMFMTEVYGTRRATSSA